MRWTAQSGKEKEFVLFLFYFFIYKSTQKIDI